MTNSKEKSIVIIPTYNEIDNIEKMIQKVLSLKSKIDILIIDDNSPDGTGQFVEDNYNNENRVHLVRREGKLGLGTAYVTGFKYALERGYDYIMEMDCDFSHNPDDLEKLLEEIKDYDLVIGSRYIQGVNVINWPLSRLLLSIGASIYTRLVTGMPIRDTTSGFKCFRKVVLESIDLDSIRSNGYGFQIEMHYKTWLKKFRIKEHSITFTDRVDGVSKMDGNIVKEAIFMVWKLRFPKLFGH
ncbi:MAG: dolichyl-phosphate beta-D-mannosyltransferase [Candidatus Cloacimonadota bacterium]|nr:MAG: dolichyl-phosphate beta-D-mannosyltransferase [Candidatus Cloacimonadota bacterium]PIE78464.1 MAG: dolichyl-phosphate beta-D-mannosyltransferase [Candidatus Delongbacteria bacterium]